MEVKKLRIKKADKILELIERLRGKTVDWEITDTIIKAEDLIPKQPLHFSEKYNFDGPFVCIRNYYYTCIYIKEEDFERFKKIKEVYYEKENLINLTKLFQRHFQKQECITQVMNKTVPQSVVIKELRMCIIHGIDVYVTRVINLMPEDQLFEDLINLQIMKDKYHLQNKGGYIQ